MLFHHPPMEEMSDNRIKLSNDRLVFDALFFLFSIKIQPICNYQSFDQCFSLEKNDALYK